MTLPCVLIIGANGRFGRAATTAFAQAGWRVLAQGRKLPAGLPPGVQALNAPLDDCAALAAQAAAARVVVYAVNPPYTAWATQMLPLARKGLDVAERLGAMFMLPGNVYAYGRTMPALLSENTPEQPSTEKGWLRQQLEADIRERTQAGRMTAVVLRAGDFFGGSGSGTWLDLAIAKSIARGRLVYPGPLQVPHAWAYLPDLAKTLVALAESRLVQAGEPAYEVLHFAGHTLTGEQMMGHLKAAAGMDCRVGRVPWPVWRALAWVVPMLREVCRMAYLWQVPHALDDRRLQAALAARGGVPHTPAQQAVAQALLDLGLLPTPASSASSVSRIAP